MSSPIISGLIALSDSGRSSVSVPISPSIAIESVFIVGGPGAGVVVVIGAPSWSLAQPSDRAD